MQLPQLLGSFLAPVVNKFELATSQYLATAAMAMATIEITEGIQERTSRLSLKKTMQVFGEVDACHMGDRAVMGDRFTEFPIVRFKTQTAAENAVKALNGGTVFLDGFALKGGWRGGSRRPAKQPPPGIMTSSLRADDEISSRMLLEAPSKRARSPSARRQSPKWRSHSPPRRGYQRSRSRRRSRSRHRKASRSRSGGHRRRGGPTVAAVVLPLTRLSPNLDAGNGEFAVSDNPLYRAKRQD